MKQVCSYCGVCYGHKCPKCGEQPDLIEALGELAYDCKNCTQPWWLGDGEPETHGICPDCLTKAKQELAGGA